MDKYGSSNQDSNIYRRLQACRSGWLDHLKAILDGTKIIIEAISEHNVHVLVHCSDGWDRTSQLVSLAQICLDPFFRTIEGLMVLIEKDWCSFGHKFSVRCGHLSHEGDFTTHHDISNPLMPGVLFSQVQSIGAGALSYAQKSMHRQSGYVRETSPVFQQFLDCCYQLWTQQPARFEWDERLLLWLHVQSYSCQYSTFLCNSDRERREKCGEGVCWSAWSWLRTNIKDFINPLFDPSAEARIWHSVDRGVIVPDTRYMRYWIGIFARRGLKDSLDRSALNPKNSSPAKRDPMVIIPPSSKSSPPLPPLASVMTGQTTTTTAQTTASRPSSTTPTTPQLKKKEMTVGLVVDGKSVIKTFEDVLNFSDDDDENDEEAEDLGFDPLGVHKLPKH